MDVLVVVFPHAARSYFRFKWNCLDAFVVVVSLIALAAPQASIFRAFRAMRPLRVIVRSKKIRVRAVLVAEPMAILIMDAGTNVRLLVAMNTFVVADRWCWLRW